MNDMLGFPILLRCIRTGKVEEDAMGHEKVQRKGIHEFMTVVGLNGLYRESKLHAHIGGKDG